MSALILNQAQVCELREVRDLLYNCVRQSNWAEVVFDGHDAACQSPKGVWVLFDIYPNELCIGDGIAFWMDVTVDGVHFRSYFVPTHEFAFKQTYHRVIQEVRDYVLGFNTCTIEF